MIGISDLTKKKGEFQTKAVKYFGVEVYEVLNTKGVFSSFKKRNWIKTNEKIFVDYKISEIRQWFDQVVLIDKKEHLKRSKKDKIKKAISKTYEIVEKNTIYLSDYHYHELIHCNRRKTLFVYKNETFYFIIDNIYRSNNNYKYYWINEKNRKFEETGFSLLTNIPTKAMMLEWVISKEMENETK